MKNIKQLVKNAINSEHKLIDELTERIMWNVNESINIEELSEEELEVINEKIVIETYKQLSKMFKIN